MRINSPSLQPTPGKIERQAGWREGYGEIKTVGGTRGVDLGRTGANPRISLDHRLRHVEVGRSTVETWALFNQSLHKQLITF